MDKALEVFGMIFVADHQSAEVEEPGKEALDLPTSDIAPERASILRGDFPVALVGGDHFRSVTGHESFVNSIHNYSYIHNESPSTIYEMACRIHLCH